MKMRADKSIVRHYSIFIFLSFDILSIKHIYLFLRFVKYQALIRTVF